MAPAAVRRVSSAGTADTTLTTERQLFPSDLRKRLRAAERDDNDFRPVLMDDDLKVYTGGHPLILTVDALDRLKDGLAADLDLLEECEVMDYSLLLGIDRQSGQICIGLIDYMRRYDALKVMESAFKNLY